MIPKFDIHCLWQFAIVDMEPLSSVLHIRTGFQGSDPTDRQVALLRLLQAVVQQRAIVERVPLAAKKRSLYDRVSRDGPSNPVLLQEFFLASTREPFC